jgi:hypothetical protein
LTITPENERRIQGFRSITLGLEPAIDFDYTTAVNLLLDMGFHVLAETGQQRPSRDVKIDSQRIAYILGYYSALATDSKTIIDFEDYEKRLKQTQPAGLFAALAKLQEFQPKNPSPNKSGRQHP